jgi:hypothetical protein
LTEGAQALPQNRTEDGRSSLTNNKRETQLRGALSDNRVVQMRTDELASAPTGNPQAGMAHVAMIRRDRKLLRKEVIQPHLPVRLPCYDFTPIADPTFGSSLPCGLGH